MPPSPGNIPINIPMTTPSKRYKKCAPEKIRPKALINESSMYKSYNKKATVLRVAFF